MATYQVIVPFQDDMGSITPFYVHSTPMESARENALWRINSMRRHDNLSPLQRLPAGTVLDKVS
jgi:hypothetical protein